MEKYWDVHGQNECFHCSRKNLTLAVSQKEIHGIN